MTAKQQQCLLVYLGYDIGQTKDGLPMIDGIAGAKTLAALAQFRKDYGCGPDGLPGAVAGTVPKLAPAGTVAEPVAPGAAQEATSGTFWDRVKHFTRSEFRCPCGKCSGFPVEPTEEIVMEADALREAMGRPVIIVPPDGHSGGSGVRCPAYNATFSNSVSNSRHLQGKAVDFSVPGVSSATVEAYLNQRRNAGKLRYWYRISAGSWHMDVE